MLVLASGPMPATQSTALSSEFHSAPTTPPGRSTRAISTGAVSGSNQWNAWPTSTASTESSGSGIRSADPGSAWTWGIPAGQFGEHVGIRFDGRHLEAERHQALGELAGAGRQVQHLADLVGRAGECPPDPVGRVVGSVLRVRGRACAEGLRAALA